jgi:hypothetical protein
MITDTTEQALAFQISTFSRMSPQQRWKATFDLNNLSQKLVKAGIVKRHPDYDQQQINLAFIRTRLSEELFLKLHPEAKAVLP